MFLKCSWLLGSSRFPSANSSPFPHTVPSPPSCSPLHFLLILLQDFLLLVQAHRAAAPGGTVCSHHGCPSEKSVSWLLPFLSQWKGEKTGEKHSPALLPLGDEKDDGLLHAYHLCLVLRVTRSHSEWQALSHSRKVGCEPPVGSVGGGGWDGALGLQGSTRLTG